ncbi:GFA family protein [Pseudomonas kuykendallii]|uniref:Aldehyde-activating protein n=1 Tax=Pseudomonas kuykendallii TaxID=1007099 RepID=A0A2W5CRU3_9PSED|nr:GFA family protein [Pseudomonas kuykendallii]PZP22345.1 MAG: aldehyde-activating protein [Pseudomonas kuykendallii]
MQESHQGGCHCGALRYRFAAPLRDIAHCHCSICRRTSGGLVTTWIGVPLERFEWLRGTPAQYASSDTCTRYFCGTCGAQLALFTRLSPQTLDVTIATLDEPQRAPADRHIWVTTRLPWLTLDPHLPSEDEEAL